MPFFGWTSTSIAPRATSVAPQSSEEGRAPRTLNDPSLASRVITPVVAPQPANSVTASVPGTPVTSGSAGGLTDFTLGSRTNFAPLPTQYTVPTSVSSFQSGNVPGDVTNALNNINAGQFQQDAARSSLINRILNDIGGANPQVQGYLGLALANAALAPGAHVVYGGGGSRAGGSQAVSNQTSANMAAYQARNANWLGQNNPMYGWTTAAPGMGRWTGPAQPAPPLY